MSHVLLAEDDADSAEVLCEMLRDAGHRVTHVSTVHGLLATLRTEPVDVTILDLSVVNGATIERQFVPLIIFSARTWQELDEASERLGAVAVLQKPNGLGKLLETIAGAVKARVS